MNGFVAQQRLAILDDLRAGRPPRIGTFDEASLREARSKGTPQAGANLYHPHQILFEFIYPDPRSSSSVFTVTVPAPERIVYLPVPSWVIENIWQGEISGSFHFETEAKALLDELVHSATPEVNETLFGPTDPKRRD